MHIEVFFSFSCPHFIPDVKGAGRGAIAEKDLKVGDIALEIPVSIIINEELVCQTDMVLVLVEKLEYFSFKISS